MSIRKVVGLLAGFALAVGLIGAGVGAQFTDSVTAVEHINVGTFACQITAATPALAVIAGDGKSVEYTAPTIMSSAAGTAPFTFTVKNTGSMTAVLTVSSSGVSSPFYDMMTPIPAAQTILPAGSYTYSGGVGWTELSTPGQSGSLTYTVACTDTYVPGQ